MLQIRTLRNGIRVAMEPMEHVRSVSIGVWVNTGSVREIGAEAGASHFIEHMLFEGTERRSAAEIASEMDAIGGNLNACTSRECTCFYAKVLDERLPTAVDMLSDIVFHSVFPEAELKKEKGVVVEEILMLEDNPEDLTAEVANALFFGNDPLAKPIVGTQESVRAFTKESLFSYMAKHYVPKNIVVACAGHFDPETFMELLDEKFDAPESELMAAPLAQGYPGGKRMQCVVKDVEQTHITLMLPGAARGTQEQYTLAVLSNILGGSMSSRLFQNIREKRGLAYSVYSYPISYTSTGTFSLYAGTGEKQAVEVTRLMLEELDRIRTEGVSEEEFVRGKEQLRGNYLLGMESSGAIMDAIGKVALLQNREYREEETLKRMECVTMGDIQAILPRVCGLENLSAAFVGRVGKHEHAFSKLLGV